MSGVRWGKRYGSGLGGMVLVVRSEWGMGASGGCGVMGMMGVMEARGVGARSWCGDGLVWG